MNLFPFRNSSEQSVCLIINTILSIVLFFDDYKKHVFSHFARYFDRSLTMANVRKRPIIAIIPIE